MKRLLISLISAGCLLAACGAPSAPSAPATSAPAATATPAPANALSATTPIAPTNVPPTAVPPTPTAVPPTATVVPTLSPPTLSAEQIAAYTAELSATVAALIPQPTPDATGAIGPTFDGVSVWPLTTANGAELWVAYSTGMRDFSANLNHFIAIYAHTVSGWQQTLKFDLEFSDYVDASSVRQVLIEPTHLWLAVDSGAGAHSGCFNLYAIDPDGRSQIEAAANCSDHPGAGEVRDLNGDGQLDVMLDHTNSYVFCYACGVRYFNFSVLRWDGTQLIEQTLTPLPDSAPAEVRQTIQHAIDLAQGGLWKDAQVTIGPVATADPIARWDAALIDLYSQAWLDQISNDPYPLLDHLFYGDYAATLDVMRPYLPDQLFSLTGPLIAGTQAEGWESALADWITQTTNSAIQVQPDLAAAYFLRGYGEWLADQKNPAALQDIEKAAALAPNEKLFSDSVEFLK